MHGLTDVVQSVQQQMFPKWVNIEGDFLAVRADHHLAREVDGHTGIAAELGVLDQLVAEARGRRIGRMPFLKLLLKKMSAKSGAMMQRMPKSSSAQGACSRDEPQPKFSCAMMTCAWR